MSGIIIPVHWDFHGFPHHENVVAISHHPQGITIFLPSPNGWFMALGFPHFTGFSLSFLP
jgi:hypothetical protein